MVLSSHRKKGRGLMLSCKRVWVRRLIPETLTPMVRVRWGRLAHPMVPPLVTALRLDHIPFLF